jgi:hypothetical protein
VSALDKLRRIVGAAAGPRAEASAEAARAASEPAAALDPEYLDWIGTRGPCTCGGPGIRPTLWQGKPSEITEYCPCPVGYAAYRAAIDPIRRSMREIGERLDAEEEERRKQARGYEDFRKRHPAVRGYQRYTSEQRADHEASGPLGIRQRKATGEFFYTHKLLPGRGFPSAKAATEAAYKLVRLVSDTIGRLTELGLANTGDVVHAVLDTNATLTKEDVHCVLEHLADEGKIELRPSAGATFQGPNDDLAPPGPRGTVLAYIRPIQPDTPPQSSPVSAAPPPRSPLAERLLAELVRDAQRSEYGVANTGRVIEHVRDQAGKLTEDVHAALRDLEAAGAVQLRVHAMLPPRWIERQLAPPDSHGRPLLSARPLLPYKADRDDPVLGYQIVLTMEVDHPEWRHETLPKVEAGHRYDLTEFTESRAHALRRFDQLRAGRVRDGTGPDGDSEYAAEIAVSVVTRLHRWAGWLRGPEPRARPEGSGR